MIENPPQKEQNLLVAERFGNGLLLVSIAFIIAALLASVSAVQQVQDVDDADFVDYFFMINAASGNFFIVAILALGFYATLHRK